MKGVFPWLVAAGVVGVIWCAAKSAEAARTAAATQANQVPNPPPLPSASDLQVNGINSILGMTNFQFSQS